ncbi:uncharacterized GPI-anchored protein At4g28100 [Punica granatum]|uniref:SPARK domain-containing protein n=2 Tax=Punica granatum TaxID=22663 RepID=A0A218VRI7_PUNGR|nr:uncharacterized GPI-anchored protein At4g28100 [Punica granatum]OWM62631.1 hypothetical protein CDL15_Pgr019925 [Punica granatum]PKI52822.1 hypothetical protein CRG98_026770 [Punica granatum]
MSASPPPLFAAVLLLLAAPLLPARSTAPDPDPATVQPLHLPPSPPATIPAFPEQSAAAGCPLELSDGLFHALHSACGGELRRTRCCPVLAAWLYSAYSSTALGRASAATGGPAVPGRASPPYDMPLLPDDSETCVDGLGKALKERGVQLSQPNETCDVVYCYCGIRLHPLSCPEAFFVGPDGKLRGNENVRRLEIDCFSGGNSRNGFPGLGGCSKCLNSLHRLTQNTSDPSKSEDRTVKMQNKDCHLMGLTWLLSKNRTAYIHTVSNVLRAIMMSPNGSNPQSCTLSSDGLPLAVDSTEISGSPSQFALQSSINILVLPLFVLYYRLVIVS